MKHITKTFTITGERFVWKTYISVNVDTAKLLIKKINHGGYQSTSIPADGKQFLQPVALFPDPLLFLDEVVNQKQIASCLEL